MRQQRSAASTLAASPTMVGAVTVLVAIVAVFLAYNANSGLPFVPSYNVSVTLPDAEKLVAVCKCMSGMSADPVWTSRRHGRLKGLKIRFFRRILQGARTPDAVCFFLSSSVPARRPQR